MTPFDLLGEHAVSILSPVCATSLAPNLELVAGVRKSWAEANRDPVIRFIRAHTEGVEAMYERKHRSIVEAILVANVSGMTPGLARATSTNAAAELLDGLADPVLANGGEFKLLMGGSGSVARSHVDL
jgi:ABC-type nitrate/sulfonate/bicarbonate transport system substrate-binding protein